MALGRALIAEAPVCLMDEPLSNLDAQLRLEMRREIRGLQQSLGITMVYVTHDQTEAMTMADQVILLREGRVEQDAPPEALYARPATAFAARFIGTPPMNVLALDDRRRLLGIRPEDIRVVGAKEPGAVEALVRSIEYLGADSILMCAIGRQALAVRVPGRVALAPGAPVSRVGAGRGPRVRRRDRSPSRRRRRRLTHLSMTRRPFMIRTLLAALLLVALTGGASPVIAQAPVELSFYYPVAVGGPVTKIIDGLAADFQKENPGIQVKPIYAGTYQETIVKVLTALKSGEPPQMSVLLSTDMFTLIDEDAIVPFDDLATGAEDRSWLKSFFPAFMLNSQTGGKTWGMPFQRSTIVLYWNKEAFKEAGLDPNKPPATWAEHGRVRAEAHQARRQRQRHPVGRSRCRPPASRTGSSRASPPRTTCC